VETVRKTKFDWHARMLDFAKQTNIAPIYEAFRTRSPVSAGVVDAYNILLPSGYVLKKGFPGDQYIYRTQGKKP
jgi:hypothetical protein